MAKEEETIFTDEDYKSKDGMLTYIWGPPLWHVLHTMSFNYPNNPTREQKNNYKNFIYSLKNVLPCGACRENLKKNLRDCKLTEDAIKNRKNFSKWLYRLHEKVNKMLGKESGLTYEDVRNTYENFRARCYKNPIKNVKIEDGCTNPVTGVKSKCVLVIVPKETKCKSFNMNEKCKVQASK